MPGKIEERQSGSRIALCLRRDAIEEFAHLSGLKKRGPQKTSEWLSAKELEEYFVGGRNKISNKLKKLVSEKKMPGKIEERQSGSGISLCLRRDAIEEFAHLSELKIRHKKTIRKKFFGKGGWGKKNFF
jgi:hypothetical protein